MDKLIRFIKNWTLPVAIFTGSVLYLIFVFVPALAGAATFFKPIMASLLPMFMFFTLFVVFCKVDFNKMRPVRWHADSRPFLCVDHNGSFFTDNGQKHTLLHSSCVLG